MEQKKITLLSNVTMDMVAARLRERFDVRLPDGYDAWVQETLDPNSWIYKNHSDAIVVLLDGTPARGWKDIAEAEERLSLWRQAILSLAKNIRTIPIFIPIVDFRQARVRAVSESSFWPSLEEEWRHFATELQERQGNVYAYDLRELIADIGRDRFYSDKMWYLGNTPYSLEGLKSVSDEIGMLLASAFEPRRKAVVLDLDNTLWGGVIGEDGIGGIELSDHKEGERFYDFQRRLKEMRERGILLAVISKNNAEDVWEVFDRHPYMLLRRDDFVSLKVNWADKASNMKEIEEELNLTEGSFIFIDDNPLEREAIRLACPDVLVPDFPEDTTALARFAENLYLEYMRPLGMVDEDSRKTEMYHADERRRHERAKSLSLDDFISRLEIVLDIHRMREDERERVAQLCEKTNQFNLTTIRYSAVQIAELADDENCQVYTVHALDKYGDQGLVSVLIVRMEGSDAVIDTFLMSCRVMGRKIENAIIDKIAMSYKTRARRMIGKFVPTAKNKPVEGLYDGLGFSCIGEENGAKSYELRLDSYESRLPGVFRDVSFHAEIDGC